MDAFYHRLKADLDQRKEKNLWRKIRVFSKARLNFSANDYLCLRNHPRVLQGAKDAIDRYGAGTAASPLLTGYLPCHDFLLKQLLEWKKMPAGLIFNSGFMANQAVIRHLPGKNDLILADRLVHHSIAQALTQSDARFKRYDHLDLDQLEELLAKNHRAHETVFVVTESVFSMDGDYPDLQKLVQIKKRFPFILILDEAHATGVFGPTGGGLAEEMGVLEQVDILVGTLGKALAGMGAYVLSRSPAVIDYLVNFSGELIYSTYLAPALAGTATTAIQMIQGMKSQRARLRSMSVKARQALAASGWPQKEFESPILPVIIGDDLAVLSMQSRLEEKGIWVGAVRPPTVPVGTARLRISLHTEITEEQFAEVLILINQWKK
jgi:8-amino-7-oxononanoate synthase